jgi:hypothetical protein
MRKMFGKIGSRFISVISGSLIALCASFFMALPASGGAGIEIEPMSFDCGEVAEGSPASMEATLANTGDADLTITNVRTN